MPIVLIALGGLVLALTRKTHGSAPPSVPANAAPPGTDSTPVNPITGTKLSLTDWVKAHGFVGPLDPSLNPTVRDFVIRAQQELARLTVEAAFFTMSGNPLLGVLVFNAPGGQFAELYGIGTR
jgi:hypothetical protein